MGELRERAEEHLSRISSVVHVSDPDIQALVHELQVHQIELQMQNEELRVAVEDTEMAKRKYSDLFDHAPVGYLTVDDRGLIIEANLSAASLLGTYRSDLISAPFRYFVSAESLKEFDECLSRAAETGNQRTCEAVLLRNRKDPFYSLIDIVSDGDPPQLRVAISDISERRHAEEALRKAYAEMEDAVEQRTLELRQANKFLQVEIVQRRQAEVALQETAQKYLTLFESVDEGFSIVEMIFDDQGRPVDYRFLEINPAFDKHTGISGAVGRTIREFVPDHEDHWFDTYGRVALTGEPVRFEGEAKGLGRWYDVYAFRIGEAESSRVSILFNDITSRKLADENKDEMLWREHRIASVLQRALLPTTEYDIPYCDVAVRYVPAHKEAEVGGDFYDIFVLGEGRVGIVIGDVMGKGLPSAIGVAAAKHSIRSYAYLDPRPGRVLALANDALSKNQPGEPEDSLLTAFLAVLDTRFGGVAYANGGHEPPVLRRATGTIERLQIQGRALGVEPGFVYAEAGRRLYSGDVIVMVTDGVTEAHRDIRDLFGIEGVERYLREHPNASPAQITDGIIDAARDQAGGDLSDDAVVVAVKLKNGGN